MTRWLKILGALVMAIAVPATAQTFGFSLGAAEPACLPIGNAAYRVTHSASADVTVRIEPAAAASDIRVAIADTPHEADFVFVDDGGASACSRPFKTVKIDDVAAPDLTVGLVTPEAPANYRIYVRSRWLDAETAAALFAAAQLPPRRLAARSN